MSLELRDKRHMNGGFTIVELLVVVAISLLLTSFAITYSNIAKNQNALAVEESKISQFILRARSLSIATYGGNPANGQPVACGYGVKFNLAANPQTYSIFEYSPVVAPNPCPALSTITTIAAGQELQYAVSGWNVPLSSGVKLNSQADSLLTILFYPPEPTALLSKDGQNFVAGPMSIYLSTIDGSANATLSVNSAGQINFQ